MNPNAKPWTADEDAILRREFVHGGVGACQALLPDRTGSSIYGHAYYKLGLRVSREALSRIREDAQRVRREREGAAPPPATAEQPRLTASNKPGLEPVPETHALLPWVSYPRDRHAATALAQILEDMAGSDRVRAIGPEAVRSLESQVAYLRALAARESEAA